jgi:hypothetical protein
MVARLRGALVGVDWSAGTSMAPLPQTTADQRRNSNTPCGVQLAPRRSVAAAADGGRRPHVYPTDRHYHSTMRRSLAQLNSHVVKEEAHCQP